MSAVRLVRETLPHMRGRGGGRILFILSSSVREPIDDLLLSNVMRPAVAGLAKSLSRALGEENILVNVVIPGVINTERGLHGRASLAKRLGITFEESVASVERDVPLGRLGEPEEFGAMVAFSRLTRGELHLGRRVRRRRRAIAGDLRGVIMKLIQFVPALPPRSPKNHTINSGGRLSLPEGVVAFLKLSVGVFRKRFSLIMLFSTNDEIC